MSLIPTVYRSTDPGAPVLSGTAGSFAALMDAVLVDGYGTGPDAKPGLGWVRAFSEGHKRAYQNSLADGGTGMFWRIDDGYARYVECSGYHVMSSIDNGVDPFGNTSNAWGKSVTADSTAREWVVVGNGRSAYIFVRNGVALAGGALFGYFVGDYRMINSAYMFNFGLTRSGQASVTSGSISETSLLRAASNSNLAAARTYDGGTVWRGLSTSPSLIGGNHGLGGGRIQRCFAISVPADR